MKDLGNWYIEVIFRYWSRKEILLEFIHQRKIPININIWFLFMFRSTFCC